MGKIHYTLFNPSGNMTILVDSPVSPDRQPAVAGKLMELERETEQVGFVRLPGPGTGEPVELRMAGGEFCGNATMSAASLYLDRCGERTGTVRARVAGTEPPVEVTLAEGPDGSRQGTLSMPKPLSVRTEMLEGFGRVPVVRFPGITHLIADESSRGFLTRENAEAQAPVLCGELGAEALGLMFLDPDRRSLTPLVYVPEAGTLCWESSCASGTTAAGAWLANRSGGPVTLALQQPGGTLTITAEPEGDLCLTGAVRSVRDGFLEIEEGKR